LWGVTKLPEELVRSTNPGRMATKNEDFLRRRSATLHEKTEKRNMLYVNRSLVNHIGRI